MVLTAFLFLGCKKTELQTNGSNCVIHEQNDSKASNACLFWFFSGHDGKNCPGCVMIAGKPTHVDCYGVGSKCHKATNVTLDMSGTAIAATTTDTFGLTNLDFFLMPDRSLEYLDENNNLMFLNIPAQQVYRDSTTLQFTFTGLYITNSPAYSND